MDHVIENVNKPEVPSSPPSTGHTFHKTPIVLMSLFVLLVIAAFFAGTYYQGLQANKAEKVAQISPTPQESASKKSETEWKTYVNENYSFHYPQGFLPYCGAKTSLASQNAQDVLVDRAVREGPSSPLFYVSVLDDESESDCPYNRTGFIANLKQYMTTAVGQTVAPPNQAFDATFTRLPDIKLNGEIAKVFEGYTAGGITPTEISWIDRRVIVQRNGKTYILGTYYIKSEETWKLYQQILKTFTFTDSTASASHEFSLTEAKVGDKVAGMEIESIKPYKGSAVSANLENAVVGFTGQTTVTGRYYYGGPNEVVPITLVCFEKLDATSLLKIPRIQGDDRNVWFCFDNTSFAESSFSPSGSSGTATIVIDNYTINYYPSEVYNTAKLVKVVEKK